MKRKKKLIKYVKNKQDAVLTKIVVNENYSLQML